MYKPQQPARQRGQHFEQLAENYLRRHGCRTIARNFQCRMGELDIIMLHQSTLIFVEVKYRRSQQFGVAAAQVTRAKQQRLIATAKYFLQQNPRWCKQPSRFDIVGISGDSNFLQYQWIKNAFYASH